MQQTDPRTIVYIEDDQEMIDLVSMILSRRGFESPRSGPFRRKRGWEPRTC